MVPLPADRCPLERVKSSRPFPTLKPKQVHENVYGPRCYYTEQTPGKFVPPCRMEGWQCTLLGHRPGYRTTVIQLLVRLKTSVKLPGVSYRLFTKYCIAIDRVSPTSKDRCISSTSVEVSIKISGFANWRISRYNNFKLAVRLTIYPRNYSFQ